MADITKPYMYTPPGHVSFRLLATSSPAKSVTLLQEQLTRDTGASLICVGDALPRCTERVVYIVGATRTDKTLSLTDGKGRVYEVSAAQAAAVRVYEAAAVRRCRLLVESGGEVWKRESELKRIERESGAFLWVFNCDELPLCANPDDELIQITGAFLAVKKALIAVTHCLQGHWNNSSHSHASTPTGSPRDLLVCNVVQPRDSDQSRIVDVDTREVAFRLIFPGLNGWENTVINDLEKETGASILVSTPMVGCNELLITVSAMENKDWKYSPAQNAAACVFIKSMEDGIRSTPASGGTITAKILMPVNQADGVDLSSSMPNTEVQILDDHHSPLASADDKIIHIVGELSDVHVCLFQVTWNLREKMFLTKLVREDGPRLPHEILGRPPGINQTVGITKAMDHLALSDGVNDQLKARPPELSLGIGDPLTLTTATQADCDAVTSASSSEFGSEDGIAFIRNTEVEIVIPASVFGCVYGKDGCNMARVRQITGANVVIHDPSPGTDGSAIISGTPKRTQAAMSMLWGFINAKP